VRRIATNLLLDLEGRRKGVVRGKKFKGELHGLLQQKENQEPVEETLTPEKNSIEILSHGLTSLFVSESQEKPKQSPQHHGGKGNRKNIRKEQET